METKLDLIDLAYEKGLRTIETTTGINGYPQNLKSAIVGFDTFKEAEELAREYELAIQTFGKRSGWQLWYRNGNNTYEPLKPSSYDFGDNFKQYYNIYKDIEDFYNKEGDFIKDEIKNLSFEELNDHINRLKYLYNEIESLSDDEVLITDGTTFHKFNKNLMEYSYDTKHYIIGLINK
jgi:hypothetical protein